MTSTTYNERAWQIDLISKINTTLEGKSLPVKRAGGESSVSVAGEKTLFPDVLLLGDEGGTLVLQGWELKMPDTDANDSETFNNAATKARRLRTESFIVWNVDLAILYTLNHESDEFEELTRWGPLGYTGRQQARLEPDAWKTLAETILSDINEYIQNGTIRHPSPAASLNERLIADFIDAYTESAADHLRERTRLDADFDAQVRSWWGQRYNEFGNQPNIKSAFRPLGQTVVANWLNRFFFSHFLRNHHTAASQVDSIKGDVSIADGDAIFRSITEQCNFHQVYQEPLGLLHIGPVAWQGLIHFNDYLSALRLEDFDANFLHEVLENALIIERRKVAGQFATPTALSNFLVRITINNAYSTILDPCCGSGTIARSAYRLKREKNVSAADSMGHVWASDKFQSAVQLATLALADPAAQGQPIRVFQHDVFDLYENMPVQLSDPNTGSPLPVDLPSFDVVVSNFPFVRFEDLEKYNKSALDYIQSDEFANLSKRSDVFGYITRKVHDLLTDNGRVGVITSNSWLGTAWGQSFRSLLENFFVIEKVVISSAGRWFTSADIVTTLLIMRRRDPTAKQTPAIRFVTTNTPIHEWDSSVIDDMDVAVRLGHTNQGHAHVVDQNPTEISRVEQACGSWVPLFQDMKWLDSTLLGKLRPLRDILNIARGMRRGWNPLFYPAPGHGIEPEYIRPALLTMRSVSTLTASPDGDAFCCERTIDDLQNRGHFGALKWIKRFEHEVNTSGKPLQDVLASSKQSWYQMSPSSQADFALGMNPYERLFVARMGQRGFVDQRIISFEQKDNTYDMTLLHALMNTTLGLFFIEAAGFGRALGALDLNPSKLKSHFLVLDPDVLDPNAKERIKKAFEPLLSREVEPLEKELQRSDRSIFDDTVLDEFGLAGYGQNIREALKGMYSVRQAVKQ